ncbi:MAG: hypothetical protein ACJ8E3_05965 [Sphingomicrobium sp.]
MQYKVLASAFALTVIAAPASARDNPQSNTVASKPQEKTYCVQFDDTGSHVARVECRTKKQWAQRGVDVDNPGEK